ncbi:Cytochrome P450 82A3 [Morus notabilis]|uniref:Cytochrome P450 82A3 n=1 Tax=Morus notabilis TaxID=981085 RepID=W9S3T1_9ROSA|nr:Cytochrome P450 82A3 [Morus notabilis]
MDVMLSILDESNDLSDYDADFVNKATCMVQDELDLHVGKERLVKESDISNLVYLQAVVKETLREIPAANKDVDFKGKHFELIPFGGRRKSCPEMTYGLQMTHLVIDGLLQAFDVFTDWPVEMTAIFGLTNAKATPLDVLVKPRLSISHYE